MSGHRNSHSFDYEPVEQPGPRVPFPLQTGPPAAAVLPPAPPPPVSPPTLTPSEPEDSVFGLPVVARSYGRPVVIEGPYRRVPDIPPLAPYQQLDWEASANPAMLTDFRDELARLDGVITPGVDNTPFIQYAVEALTRDRDTGYSVAGSSVFAPGQQSQSYQPGLVQQSPPVPVPRPARPPAAHPPAETARPDTQHQHPPRPFVPGPRESAQSLADSLLKNGSRPPQPHEWRPVEGDGLLASGSELLPLTFRPWPLRAPALFGFMAVCLLMIAALTLSAVYSHLHHGLLEWATIHGGRYFLFRILPQLINACILLYSQFIATTMFRILPFARLASEVRAEREGALFQELYPSFLWPRLVGPWNVWVPTLVTWLTSFTIPLQSSLFTVILVDGQKWKWATVQGVAWTLAALYLALLASTAIVWRYWASLQNTGLIWDPRSLADIAALVSETNTAADYRGTRLARGRDSIRFALRRRAGDRLGYWTWKDGRHGFWHTLGSPMDEAVLIPITDLAAGQRMQRHGEKHGALSTAITNEGGPFNRDHDLDQDLETLRTSPQARHRYLPGCLRTSQLLWFTITSVILLLALFLVSFLPKTRITTGFHPSLEAAPQPGAFSPANFLFSFLPSLLGTILFLLFQPLDTHLRILQPWAALSSSLGSPAERSLLADYAACAPGQATLHALKNHHWRVAVVSLLSTLFVLIPILAGGSFMALTTATSPGSEYDWEVRMYPNLPAYGILLGLLILYVVALLALFPARKQLRMPHAVTCLAEIIGYLVTPEMREDEAAFKRCVSRQEMETKLGVGRAIPVGMRTRWVFGFAGDNNDGVNWNVVEGEAELGVRRVRRFTEKRRVRKSQIRGPRREYAT